MKKTIVAVLAGLAVTPASAEVLRCEAGVSGPGWKFDMAVYVSDGVAVDQLTTVQIDQPIVDTDTGSSPMSTSPGPASRRSAG